MPPSRSARIPTISQSQPACLDHFHLHKSSLPLLPPLVMKLYLSHIHGPFNPTELHIETAQSDEYE